MFRIRSLLTSTKIIAPVIINRGSVFGSTFVKYATAAASNRHYATAAASNRHYATAPDHHEKWTDTVRNVLTGNDKPSPSNMLEIYSGAVRNNMIECHLPTIVVTGDQNGGKSSLLENILQRTFLPVGEGEVSRKLINIRTYPADQAYVDINGERFTEDSKIARKIEELNLYTPSDTIEVDAYGPDLRLGNYCDTPGLKYGDRADYYLEMVTNALTAENAIPLVVASATRDLATIQAIEVCKRLGVLEYAIGAFTKMDILPTNTSGLERAFAGDNPDLFLSRGWHGTISLNKKDKLNDMTYSHKRMQEREFFETNLQFYGGTDKLIETCETVIVREMIDQIPSINNKLDRQRSEAEQRLDTMEVLLNGTDNQVIGDVEHTLKKFLGSGSGLIEYNIHRHLQPVFSPVFGEICDQYVDISPSYSTELIDYHVLELLSSLGVDGDILGRPRNFEYMFRFGEGQPVLKRSEKTMKDAADIDTARSIAANVIQFTVRDNYDEEGKFIDHPSIWHAKYGNDITKVANSMDIVGGVTNAVIQAMNETLDQLDYGTRDQQISISALLKGFTEESVRSNMKAYVDVFFKHMIETKRRVVVDPRDFPKHLSAHPNFTEVFDYKPRGFFSSLLHSKNHNKLEVSVMSPVFSYVVTAEAQDQVLKELSSSIGTQVIGKIAHDLLVSVFAMNDKSKLRESIETHRDVVNLLTDLIKVNDKFKVLRPDTQHQQMIPDTIEHGEHGH
jgi:Dynamin family